MYYKKTVSGHEGVSHGVGMIHRVTQTMLVGKRALSEAAAPKADKTLEDSTKAKESRQLIVKTKLTIAEILQVQLKILPFSYSLKPLFRLYLHSSR